MINDVVGFKKQRRKRKTGIRYTLCYVCIMYVYIYIYKCISTFGNFNSKTRLV